MSVCPKCWGSGVVVNHEERGYSARCHREHYGYSLAQQARRLGISSSMLSMLERGKRSWTRELWERATQNK